MPLIQKPMLNELPGNVIPYYPGMHSTPIQRRSMGSITHLVLHETGAGIYKRGNKFPKYSPLELALHVYQNIMPYWAHFVVGTDGKPAQTASCYQVAQHVGSHGFQAYAKAPNSLPSSPIPDWWVQQAAKRPRLLESLQSAWRQHSVNHVSIGVEIVPPADRSAPLPQVQVESVAHLVNELIKEFPQIEFVTTHTLVHPIARTAQGKAWDMSMPRYEQVRAALGSESAKRAV